MGLLTLISLWAYFSYHSWIGSSEYWPVTLAGHWSDWRQAPSLIYKPIFHLVLTPLYFFEWDSVTHLRAAKAVFTLIGAASLFLIFKILRARLSWWVSGWIFCVLLFSQFGFSQFGKIRSDLLSLLFFLLGYWVLVIKKDLGWKRTLFGLIVFELLMILTTPKAFLLPVALALSCWKARRIQLRPLFWAHVSGLSSGMLALIVYTLINKDASILSSFLSLFKIGQDSFSTARETLVNSPLVRFTMNTPLLLMILFFVSLAFTKSERSDLSNVLLRGIVFSLGLLSLAFIHPLQPFYLIVLLTVFLVIFLSPQIEKAKFLYPILFLVSLIILISKFSTAYFFDNRSQLVAIKKIEAELGKLKTVRVLDGLGLAPRIPNTLNYVGPHDPNSVQWAEEELLQNRPEFVIFTSRISMLSSEVINFLQIQYRSVGPGYWLRADLMEDVQLFDLPSAILLFNLEHMEQQEN